MKRTTVFIFLIVLVVAMMCIDLMVGSAQISFKEVWSALFGSADNATKTIVVDIRLLKAVTALLAGIALSISGLQMQTLFRNPLAGPYVLGLSSGASLGVALLLLAGAGSALGIAGAAMVGAAAVMGLLLLVNERVRDVMTLLILGIMFSSAIGAIVQILQFISDEQALKSYVVWTMGSLSEVTSGQSAILATAVLIGVVLTIPTLKALNLMEVGEVFARSAGVNIRRSRFMILASTTILAGSVTAFCGPIGFVGLAVPHLARGLFNTADHRILIPAAALIGAIVLIACDMLSRQFLIPVNAVTSLAGIPVVVYIILRK